MPDSALVAGLFALGVLGWFMVACPVLCICFSIFADSINLGGAFERIGGAAVTVAFVPVFLLGSVLDAVTSPFIEDDMQYAIDNADSLRSDP